MSVTTPSKSNRPWLWPLLTLLLLAVFAAGLWFAANNLFGPAVSAEGAAKTEGYTHITSIYGRGADRLRRPTEVASDSKGNIYVADSFKHRVVVFDKEGAFARVIGGPAKVEGSLNYPTAIEVDSRGRVYVTSSEPDRVVIYGADGKPIRNFEVPTPLTMAIQRDRLYIATSQGILIGTLDGEQAGQLLTRGKKPGQIDRPTGLVVGENGTIFVADSLNYRFQAIDKSGKSLWTLGKGINPKQAVTDRKRDYGLPAGLTMGTDGVLYGVDAFNGELVAIADDGRQLGVFGSWGRQDGQFYYPTGITQIAEETFAIADTFNDRVQIVKIPSPRPPLASRARGALPWLIPLLLLAAALLLARRPVAIVTDAGGLRRADDAALLGDLLTDAKRLYVPSGTAETIEDLLQQDDRLYDVLREVDFGEAEDADPTIELASRLRGRLGLRRVAVAFPNKEQTTQAEERGIGVIEADDRPVHPDPAPVTT
ncbi:MAG: hypothetical protein HY876_07695 [Coriobacteriales bacterium]|nr:hypothetical protein [Coriobacteriales bacterium]